MEIKGLIKEGYDADLVIVDVDKKVVVDASTCIKVKKYPFW